MILIGDAVSRVRNILKAVKEDNFITDRFIYSLLMKYAKSLMFRDNKNLNLFKNSSLFKELPCVDLIDVDTVSACCSSIRTGCTIKRSKDKLPKMATLANGPLIRTVTSLDFSQIVLKTEPSIYANMTKSSNFKYNKNKYYWVIDDYLFIPDIEWEGVRVQALFEDDVAMFNCSDENSANICTVAQDRTIDVPEHLFAEIEQMVSKEILIGGQIPSDGADDNQNILR